MQFSTKKADAVILPLKALTAKVTNYKTHTLSPGQLQEISDALKKIMPRANELFQAWEEAEPGKFPNTLIELRAFIDSQFNELSRLKAGVDKLEALAILHDIAAKLCGLIPILGLPQASEGRKVSV